MNRISRSQSSAQPPQPLKAAPLAPAARPAARAAQPVADQRTLGAGRTPGIEAVLRHTASRPMPDWEGWGTKPNGRPDPNGPAKNLIADLAMAKLTLGVDTDRVNQVLQSAAPYSDPGTHAPGLISKNKAMRNGDYDFCLTGLTSVLYQHWDNPLLSEATKKHLATVVLNQEGTDHLPARWGPFGLVPETENHLLMTESSRYLKNQLVAKHGMDYALDGSTMKPEDYDNAKNGFNAWMVEHLAQFTRHDFDEYNSRPYSRYTLKAIQNLAEFAEDPAVKTMAQNTLDYLAVRFALQSQDMHRVAPFRRRAEYGGLDDVAKKDAEASRFAMLTSGEPGFRAGIMDEVHMLENANPLAAGMRYRVPKAIAGLMIDKGQPYFSRVRHENTEIHYAEEKFIVSAGGHYQRFTPFPGFKHENGQPMPTTIMFKGAGPEMSKGIQFLGRGDNDRVNNTGVYENFASGIRPAVAPELLAALKQQGNVIEDGDWKFLAVGGTYVALHTSTDPQGGDYAPTVGFSEVVDASEFPSLAAFKQKVRSLNPGEFSHYGPNRYTTTRGKTVEFVMAEPKKKYLFGLIERAPKPREITEWAIKKVWDQGKPVPVETDMTQWPLAESRFIQDDGDGFANDFPMRADGTGQVLVNNPALGKSLIMSTADPMRPLRIAQDGPLQNLTEQARVSRQASAGKLKMTVELAEASKVGYMSLKWPAGADVRAMKVYGKVDGRWTLLEDRRAPYTDAGHAFRTDFDGQGRKVEAVRFVAEGQGLKGAAAPEVFRGY